MSREGHYALALFFYQAGMLADHHVLALFCHQQGRARGTTFSRCRTRGPMRRRAPLVSDKVSCGLFHSRAPLHQSRPLDGHNAIEFFCRRTRVWQDLYILAFRLPSGQENDANDGIELLSLQTRTREGLYVLALLFHQAGTREGLYALALLFHQTRALEGLFVLALLAF